MREFFIGFGLIFACSAHAQITLPQNSSHQNEVEQIFQNLAQHSNLEGGRPLENKNFATPLPTPTFGSYVLNLTKEQFVFLDAPKTVDKNTKTFFYHIVKGDNPTVMQMLHTTANCSSQQLKIDSNTLVSLDPPKVLNYEVVKKGWIELDKDGMDQAIFKYVCFNEVTTGYTLPQPTGQAVVMYYNYLQQQKK